MKEKLFEYAVISRKFLTKKAPVLLTATAIAGVGLIIYNCIKDTKKFNKEYDEKWVEEVKENPKEIINIAKIYSSTILSTTLTVGSITCAHVLNTKRQLALVGAYTLAEKSLKEYKSKVIETIGEKKETEIVKSIVDDKLSRNKKYPLNPNNDGDGVLVFDKNMNRYFWSSKNKIDAVVNEINRDLCTMSQMFVSVNDFYYTFGEPPCKWGESLGWDIEHMLEIGYTSHLREDGLPCLAIHYDAYPNDIDTY